MSARTTLILFILVVSLGALILGIERYFPSAVELREIKRGPAPLEKEKGTRIEVITAENTRLTLVHDGHAWRIESPFSDLADPEKVAALIITLGGIEWIEKIHRSEFDDGEWEKTGLDKPRYKVRLLDGDKVLQECWFGAPAVVENSVYMGLPGEGNEMAWYLSKCEAPLVLQIPPASWRDPKLLRLPAEVITGITLVQPAGQIVLARDSEHASWMLEKPLKTRGSKERISELLSTILNLEIAEVKDSTLTAAGTSKKGETPASPTAEIKIIVQSKPRKQSYDLTLKKPADPKQATTGATTTSAAVSVVRTGDKGTGNSLTVDTFGTRNIVTFRWIATQKAISTTDWKGRLGHGQKTQQGDKLFHNFPLDGIFPNHNTQNRISQTPAKNQKHHPPNQ